MDLIVAVCMIECRLQPSPSNPALETRSQMLLTRQVRRAARMTARAMGLHHALSPSVKCRSQTRMF